jgi:hypothetical protein
MDEQAIIGQMKHLADQLAARRGTPVAVVLIEPTVDGYERVAPQLVMKTCAVRLPAPRQKGSH